MKDIIISAITLGIISAIARLILPRIKMFVAWLINLLVNNAEKKITGSKMGDEKKAYVIKNLKLFGVKTNDFISDMIDGTVDAMNNKKVTMTEDIKENIQSTITEKIEDTVDNTTTVMKNKLGNNDSKE